MVVWEIVNMVDWHFLINRAEFELSNKKKNENQKIHIPRLKLFEKFNPRFQGVYPAEEDRGSSPISVPSFLCPMLC